MSLLDSLPHTATIRKRVPTQGSRGGDTVAWSVTSTGVACWAQVASQREVNQYKREYDLVVTHKVYFNVDPATYFGGDQSLGSKYSLLMTSGPFNGQSLEVRSVAGCTAGMGLAWKVMCEFDATELRT